MSASAISKFLENALNTSNFQLVPYASHGTNLHYRVETQQTWFLKVFQTNQLQVVSRPKQFFLQRQIAAQNLAPQPVALSDCESFWLEEWVGEQREKPNHDFVDGQKLAEAMAQIHALKVDCESLDLKAEWRRYIELGHLDNFDYADKVRELLGLYEEHNELCFCHNDLHASHLIQRQGGLTILDWEYAALGNRYFDLAACIQVNRFNKTEQSQFLQHYAQQVQFDVDATISRTQQMLTVVDFTAELWHNAYNHINKSMQD